MPSRAHFRRRLQILIALPWLLVILLGLTAATATHQLLLDAANKPTTDVSLSSTHWTGTLDAARLPSGIGGSPNAITRDPATGALVLPAGTTLDAQAGQRIDLINSEYVGLPSYLRLGNSTIDMRGIDDQTGGNITTGPGGDITTGPYAPINTGYGSSITTGCYSIGDLLIGDGGGDYTSVLTGPHTLGFLDAGNLYNFPPPVNVVHLSGTETITGAKTFSLAVGVPTAPTGTNTTQAASTAFVASAIATATNEQSYSGTGGNYTVIVSSTGGYTTRVRITAMLTSNLNIILPPTGAAMREVRVEDPSGFSTATYSVYAITSGTPDTLNGSAGYTKILSGVGAATVYNAGGNKWLYGGSYVASPGVLYLRANGAAVDISSAGGNSYFHGWNVVDASSRLIWDTQGYLSFYGPGMARFNNAATTGFTSLTFGPSTATTTSMQFSGTLTRFRTGDNSADAPISASAITLNPVITPLGATGGRTINAAAGTIRIAAGQSSANLSNSLITTATKFRVVQLQTPDATAKSAVASTVVDGVAAITLNAATTGEVEVYFELAN